MTAGIKWKCRKHFIQQQLPSCDSEWFRKWQEVWKLVLTAPSRCQDVCMCVRSGSFVFPITPFPTAARQLPHLNASRQMRQPLRIRETKGTVAIVTEAWENSSSSSPESLARRARGGPSPTEGPPSRGAGRAFPRCSSSLPALLLLAV